MDWLSRPRVSAGDVKKTNGTISISASGDRDSVLSSITKWIPVEVIAFYEGVTTPFGDALAHGLIYAVGAGVIVTFFWIAFATQDDKRKRIAWRQVVLSCVAFLFWVIGTTSPDLLRMAIPVWDARMNSVTLAIGAIILPILDGILRRLGVPQD